MVFVYALLTLVFVVLALACIFYSSAITLWVLKYRYNAELNDVLLKALSNTDAWVVRRSEVSIRYKDKYIQTAYLEGLISIKGFRPSIVTAIKINNKTKKLCEEYKRSEDLKALHSAIFN